MRRQEILRALAALGEDLASRNLRGGQSADGAGAQVPAHRIGEDDDDVRLLAGQLGMGAAKVLDLVEQTAGSRWLTPAVRFFVEAALDPGSR
jgi:hypothetical protein